MIAKSAKEFLLRVPGVFLFAPFAFNALLLFLPLK